MPLSAAWPISATGKTASEAGPNCTQLIVQMAMVHLPAISQHGQALSMEDVVIVPASSMRAAGAAPMAFAAATGESTSPMLTRVSENQSGDRHALHLFWHLMSAPSIVNAHPCVALHHLFPTKANTETLSKRQSQGISQGAAASLSR